MFMWKTRRSTSFFFFFLTPMPEILNCINSHVCLPIIRQRQKDHFIQNLQSKIQCELKCYMYKYLVDNFCLQFYLEKSIPKLYKKCITKIRVSSHNLCIESGRHKNIPRDNRFCKTWTSTIEDVLVFFFHFSWNFHLNWPVISDKV